MPRIDPQKLLSCLGVLLAPNGGIKSASEVKRLASLMGKYSKKLVSKCIYLEILKCTETDLLDKFMTEGGWSLVYLWLSDGIDSKNWPLVKQLLELLLSCPVDVLRLKSNSAPKLVKGLSKDNDGDEDVRILATKLVEQWLRIVKDEIVEEPKIPMVHIKEEVDITASSTLPDDIIECENNTNGFIQKSDITDGNDEADNKINEQNDNDKSRVKPGTIILKITRKDGKAVSTKIDTSSNKKNNLVSNGESDLNDVMIKNEPIDDYITYEPTGIIDTVSMVKEEVDINNDVTMKTTRDRDKSSDKSRDREKSRDKDKNRKSSSSSSHRSASSSSKHHSSSSNSSKSSTKSSSSSKSSHRDKDKDRKSSSHSSSKSSSSSKEKTSSSSSNKDKSSLKSSISKESEKAKEEKAQSERDKDTLAKVTPLSIDKLGKIPKKPKDESGNPIDSTAEKPSTKKPSISIEVRNKDAENRPSTVKKYYNQYRSHGLAEEAPPPPSRRGLKKPSSSSSSGTALPSTLPLKRPSSPTNSTSRQEVIEKKQKIDIAPQIDKPGSVKIIKPKPLLMESDMFMDALSASANNKKDAAKKRKRALSSSKEPTTPTEGKPPSPKQPVQLKFYQDTLEANSPDDKSSDKGSPDKNDDDDVIAAKKSRNSVLRDESVEEEMSAEVTVKVEDEIPEEPPKKVPGPGCGPDGPPGVLVLHKRKGPKKQLRWRTQDDLEEIRYFELDETERVNVSRPFGDMSQMERMNEREAFQQARRLGSDDIMVEQIQWQPLIMVDGVPEHPNGSSSNEKKVQTDRESTVLQALYFNRGMIPDSATEPDLEHLQATEIPIIPLEDVTGAIIVEDYSQMPWPEPKADITGSRNIGLTNAFGNVPFNAFNNYGNLQAGNWIVPGAQQTILGTTISNIGLNTVAGLQQGIAGDNLNAMNIMNLMPAGAAANMLQLGGIPTNQFGMVGNFIGGQNIGAQSAFNNIPMAIGNNNDRGVGNDRGGDRRNNFNSNGPRNNSNNNNGGNWYRGNRRGTNGPNNSRNGNWTHGNYRGHRHNSKGMSRN